MVCPEIYGAVNIWGFYSIVDEGSNLVGLCSWFDRDAFGGWEFVANEDVESLKERV